MSYTAPTVKIFKLRFPEFAVVDNELVDLVLAESISAVGDGWLEKDRARAQMLLSAHTLAMEGEPARSQSLNDGGTVNSPVNGSIIEMKDRDVTVKLTDKASQISENSKLGDISKTYMQTPYGVDYYLLLGRNCSSVAVV